MQLLSQVPTPSLTFMPHSPNMHGIRTRAPVVRRLLRAVFALSPNNQTPDFDSMHAWRTWHED